MIEIMQCKEAKHVRAEDRLEISGSEPPFFADEETEARSLIVLRTVTHQVSELDYSPWLLMFSTVPFLKHSAPSATRQLWIAGVMYTQRLNPSPV